MQVLEREWSPPPHDLEHSPQSAHAAQFPSTELEIKELKRLEKSGEESKGCLIKWLGIGIFGFQFSMSVSWIFQTESIIMVKTCLVRLLPIDWLLF